MYKVILFTNRNVLVFDEKGEQHDFQDAVDCYSINVKLLNSLLSQPARYYVAKWADWEHEISKKEFEYLLGQRTLEKDISELKTSLEA